MKHCSKLLGLTLAVSALFFTACTKKPVRAAGPDSTQLGNNNNSGIDPTQIAVDGNPPPNLTARDNVGTPSEDNKSVVEPIYFALDRFAVAGPERPKAETAAKWLKDNPDKNLVLIGYCDWRGTAEYNLGLGDHRANSVKKYLEFLGVDPKRLETLSKGSTEAKQGGTEADWAKDRRVDFIILKH
jgi:peptidoglycan-associated lipoprotein